ncbi:precorrin-3B synthase [Dactylosporangium sp. CA-092794]|uniref:precorrin-3B synthase n=1 Tax=Dactylosporangium sp. CA-092794 TaxID=3239929 RepID=UPI003D8CA4DC
MQAASGRDAPDRCPGAVQVHPAADGGLARVRLPGGRLTAAQLGVLRGAAAELGDPALELTSRGNVQVRALRPGAERELAARLFAAGLLPSESHERVRNIIASPLSGLDGRGEVDVRPIVAGFDALLRATPELAGLPGRFLATIDDGRGDVTPLGGDVGLHGSRLLLAGRPTTAAGGAELLVRAAAAFQQERVAQGSRAWRLVELEDGIARVAARLGVTITANPINPIRPANAASRATNGPLGRGAGDAAGRHTNKTTEQTSGGSTSGSGGRAAGVTEQGGGGSTGGSGGVVEQSDGALAVVVVVPLGLLTAERSAVLAESANEMIVTPWRTVVLTGVPMREAERTIARLAEVGLDADPASPWAGVTACAGRPGCAKALADVRADARAAVAAAGKREGPGARAAVAVAGKREGPDRRAAVAVADEREGPGALPVHWAGCERRCGAPRGRHVEMVATGAGYRSATV